MNSIVVGLLGFATIVAIVVTLFKSKMTPALAFICYPSILALILVLVGYYSVDDIGELIKQGFTSTGPTAALFVFSVTFFGIMTDAGMFDVIINKLMSKVGDSVMGVSIMTCVLAIIGHLDGGGASTFLIVVPSMLPIYKKMHMRATSLLRIAVLSMGVMNLMPWAGPTMRAASVLGMEAGSLWRTIVPVQIFGIILAMAHAVLTGFQEKTRGAGLHGKLAAEEGEVILSDEEKENANELARPKLFAFNLILTIAVIAMLIWDKFPSYYPFMLGVLIALLVNYRHLNLMKKVLNSHAEASMMMCTTLMGAAVLMGIMVKAVPADGATTLNLAISSKLALPEGTETASVVTCMSDVITMILPDFLGKHLPIVIGVLSVPLALAFDTDSYFYGMLPVMIGIGASYGVDALPIAIAMVICRNCATFISPMVPATLLGLGLADVSIKDHIKNSFLYVWAFSIICMIFSIIIGIIPL
ncbi:MAG: CitMHS family transporter [Bilifractor sp.]|jgi:CitMHS family citrate-Mg2+:H+ or citrate-Ca2+:H+ symporter